MKAFLALALEAVEGLNPDTLREPLLLLATADEESTMDGARALVALGRPRGRYALIGEPTDLVPVRAHKGFLMQRIQLIGRAGHSSDPRLGVNALDGMARVLAGLMALRGEWAERYRHPGFEVPSPTLNLGRIQGGDSANRICGECVLDIDVRLLPGMDPGWVREQLERRCTEVLDGSGLTLVLSSALQPTAPHELAADNALVAAAEQLTGSAASCVGFATEAPYLAQLGTETLVLGPGGISEAHKPDEFVRAERLAPTVRLLQAMTERLCKTAGP
jgi:acetylornithine deacetylase